MIMNGFGGHMTRKSLAITAAACAVLATTGLVSSGLAHAGAAMHMPGTGIPVVRIDKMFDNCQAAEAYYSQGVPPAWTKLEYKTTFSAPELRERSIGVWTADVYAKTTFNISDSRIIMDVVRWEGMTRADRVAARGLDAALQAHEEGHVKWEARVLRFYQHYLLRGAGLDAQAAMNDLLVTETKYEQDIDKIMKFESGVYDFKTDHGLAQHNIGGKDTGLVCPRR